MRFGLDLFEIAYAPNEDLKYVEDEIKQLHKVWETKQQWEQEWSEKENTPFRKIQLTDLEDIVFDFRSTIEGWERYKEVQKWEVVKWLFAQFDKINGSLELVECL